MCPAPLFTSDPSEYTKLEGLYITETAPQGFIAGADRGTVGIVGATVRGPVDRAVEITSPARFLEVFGGRDYTANGTGGALINEIWEAMLGKPFGKLVIVRATALAALKASFTLETLANGTGVEVLRVDASSPGVWGNSVKIKVEAATDGDATHFNLRLKYLGETKLYENLNITTGNDNTLVVVGDDDANWITLTKLASGTPITTGMAGLDSEGFVNLGQTVASFTSVLGTDGTIADADYTGSGRGINVIKDYRGVAVVMVAKRATTAVKAAMLTAAQAASDRMFLIWNGTLGASVAAVVADAALYRSDRVVYCYNSPYVLDTQTAQQIQVPPHAQLASIFSQTRHNKHVGSVATKKFTAGIMKLTFESLTRQDYKDLRAAGICALERSASTSGGFVFVSGVTTNLTPGLTEIARRRSADFLQLSAASRLEEFVKEDNTDDTRAAMGGELVAFCDSLRRANDTVEEFSIDQVTPNTALSRAQGLEFIEWRVKLIGHILGLVLRTQIGTGTTIAEDSAA